VAIPRIAIQVFGIAPSDLEASSFVASPAGFFRNLLDGGMAVTLGAKKRTSTG
jgi:hypothetical protein